MARPKKSKAVYTPGVRPPKEGDSKSIYKQYLESYVEKAFTVTQEWEQVTSEHIGRKVKYRYAHRNEKFIIFAYVIQEPLNRNYVRVITPGKATASLPIEDVKLADVKKPKKKRGRKPRVKKEEKVEVTPPLEIKEETPPPPKKRRGRPPKVAEVAAPPKKRRGRPPKAKTVVTPAEPVKKRRGRPPKKKVAEQVPVKRKRGRPRKNDIS